MKRLFLLIPIFITIISLSACDTARVVRGTGQMGQETREVSGFNSIILEGIGTIFIEQGDRPSLRIEAEDNLLQYLETEVEGQTLTLSSRRGINIIPTQGIFYYLTVSDLQQVAVNGLGNVDIAEIESSRLILNINGGGEINAQTLNVDQLQVTISGLGSLNLESGQALDQSVQIDGGGSYDARNLAGESAQVSINGLGSATVWAKETLDVSIDGGGSVQYVGKPQVIQQINGVGEVTAIDE